MRIKFEVTLKGEYEAEASYYPEGTTVEEMAALDKLNFTEDPLTALSICEKLEVTVTPKPGGDNAPEKRI